MCLWQRIYNFCRKCPKITIRYLASEIPPTIQLPGLWILPSINYTLELEVASVMTLSKRSVLSLHILIKLFQFCKMFCFNYSRLEWILVPIFLEEIAPLTQTNAAQWCEQNLHGGEITLANELVSGLCIVLGATKMDLRQRVHDQLLNTQSFTWTTIERWVEASNLSVGEFLQHYATMGVMVDGLFIWLSSVCSQMHLNLVHNSVVWTTRSTDIANMMDATVVYASESFLAAISISPRPAITAIKSDYCNPMDTLPWFVDYPVVLRYLVANPKAWCANKDIEPMGREWPLHHLLAELFSQPLQYRFGLVSWIKRSIQDLGMVTHWCVARGQLLQDY